MKVTLASDLHLEFGEIQIKNTYNTQILVLCGDICVSQGLKSENSRNYKQFDKFFTQVSNEFEYVLYVLGNHEYYKSKWYQTQQIIREYLKKFSNIYLLEGDEFVVNNINFIGGTLWTNMNNLDPVTMLGIQDLLSDFRVIKNETNGYRSITSQDVVARFTKTLDRFKVLVENKENVVVLTHHAPHSKSVPSQFISQRVTNGAYYSDLSDFILDNPQIKLWMHGHMHNNSDYLIGNCRVVCNPRGYHGYEAQSGNFNPIVIEI